MFWGAIPSSAYDWRCLPRIAGAPLLLFASSRSNSSRKTGRTRLGATPRDAHVVVAQHEASSRRGTNCAFT